MIELTGLMIRREHFVEVRLMAGIACCRQILVDLIHVTLFAFRFCMRSGERIIRLCVIECGRFPQQIRKTGETILRELTFHMIRCDKVSDILQMAGITFLRRSFERAGGMAL